MNMKLSSSQEKILHELVNRGFVPISELKELGLVDLDQALFELYNNKLVLPFKGKTTRYSVTALGKQTLSKQQNNKLVTPIKTLQPQSKEIGVPPIEEVKTIKSPIKKPLQEPTNSPDSPQIVLDRIFKLYESNPERAFKVLAKMVVDKCLI